MELKLKDNDNIRLYGSATDVTNGTSSTVSDNFKNKVSGLMISGCPNVSSMNILDTVRNYQHTNFTNPPLKNFRIQLDKENGSTSSKTTTFDELTAYSVLAGNDGTTYKLSGYGADGSINSKPAFEGIWTLSDYVDEDMLDSLSGETNGIYQSGSPILSSDYRINWNEIAVQCVDSSKPNYNPAVSIILYNHLKGEDYDNTQHFPGKWWLTKNEASRIKSFGNWFTNTLSVCDIDGIVIGGGVQNTYNFTSFNELSSFTSIDSVEVSAFCNDTNLTNISIPNTINSIGAKAFYGCNSLSNLGFTEIPNTVSSIGAHAFEGCNNVAFTTIGSNLLTIDEGAFVGCSNIRFTSLPDGFKYLSDSVFKNCSNVCISEIPSSVGFVGQDALYGCTSPVSCHWKRHNDSVMALSGAFGDSSATYPIYIGDGESAWFDLCMVNSLISSNECSGFKDRIHSFYTKKYSDLIPNGYTIQEYVRSDGMSHLSPTDAKYSDGTKFVSDILFDINESDQSGNMVHGSDSVGLYGNSRDGLKGKVAGNTISISTSADFSDEKVHEYSINLVNSEIIKDTTSIIKYDTPTEGDESAITFFGNNGKKFIGKSYMNRIYSNGSVSFDFVPVKENSTGKIGFYDVSNNVFYGADYFTSDDTSLKVGDQSSNDIITEDEKIIEFD